MNAKNVPIAKPMNCHVIERFNAASTEPNTQPTEKQATANPLVNISITTKTNATNSQICHIVIIFTYLNFGKFTENFLFVHLFFAKKALVFAIKFIVQEMRLLMSSFTVVMPER